MKTRLTILSAERRENVYEGNRKSVSYVCKTIIHGEGGAVDVGTLRVPEALAPEGIVPGDYYVDYRAGRGFSEDKVLGVLCLFEAMGKSSAPASVQAAAKPA